MDTERWNPVIDNIFTSILSQLDSFLGGKSEASRLASDSERLVAHLQDLHGEIEAAGGRRPTQLVRENEILLEEAEALREQVGGSDDSVLEQLTDLYREIETHGSPSELKEIIEQLLAQLDSLYRDLEEAEGRSPPELLQMIQSLVEQLHALYEDKERSAEDNPELVQSLTEQLHALYAEREEATSVDLSIVVESLNAQLHDLYQEKEMGASSVATTDESLVEQLHAVYEERETYGDPKELSEVLRGLNEQLHALYSEKEESGGQSVDELQGIVDGLNEQLQALYQEKEEATDPQTIIDSLYEQLYILYEEKELADGRSALELSEMVQSLNEQLASLYEEQDKADGQTVSELLEIVGGLNEQLHDIYTEREKNPFGPHQGIVDSLEAQVCAFAEEKIELEARLEEASRVIREMRARAKALVMALAEGILAPPSSSQIT